MGWRGKDKITLNRISGMRTEHLIFLSLLLLPVVKIYIETEKKGDERKW